MRLSWVRALDGMMAAHIRQRKEDQTERHMEKTM